MNIILRVLLLFLLLTGAISYVSCGRGLLSNSHIDSNIPDKVDFQNFLARDLQSYFKELLKKTTIRVDYELLRDSPTQAGMAYPKYYAWIKILENNELMGEGAVRLAAIEKKKFDITDYLSKEDIKRNPTLIERTFPKALVEIIKKKAGL